jgi:sulfite reductase alpha subunit-like flavoprotein
MIHFTPNEDEKEKLREFISPAGQDDLYTYCHRVKRTIFEVLTDFRDVKIPLDYMLDVFPIIMPRSFSIASAPLESVQEQQQDMARFASMKQVQHLATTNGTFVGGISEGELQWKIDLCIAIVHYKTKIWKWRTGICTKWLKSLIAAHDPVAAEDADIKKEPSQFWIRIQRGTLKLPKDPSTPLICIGPGKIPLVLMHVPLHVLVL